MCTHVCMASGTRCVFHSYIRWTFAHLDSGVTQSSYLYHSGRPQRSLHLDDLLNLNAQLSAIYWITVFMKCFLAKWSARGLRGVKIKVRVLLWTDRFSFCGSPMFSFHAWGPHFRFTITLSVSQLLCLAEQRAGRRGEDAGGRTGCSHKGEW